MPFRYAGGKKKVVNNLVDILAQFLQSEGSFAEFREPFFGGGAVGLRILEVYPQLTRAWFNDRDPAVCAAWKIIARNPAAITSLARGFEPSVDNFYTFRDELRHISSIGEFDDYLDLGFKKLACHRMSYSGLGSMAGGPIGGRKQAGRNEVSDRYNRDDLAKRISRASKLFAAAETHPDVCSCLDFEIVIRAPGRAAFYLDPPYVAKGPGLYQFSFDERDHRRLAGLLRGERRPWLLSYDQHTLVDELYRGWANVVEFEIRYSAAGARLATELLISNRHFELPDAQVKRKFRRPGNVSDDLLRN